MGVVPTYELSLKPVMQVLGNSTANMHAELNQHRLTPYAYACPQCARSVGGPFSGAARQPTRLPVGSLVRTPPPPGRAPPPPPSVDAPEIQLTDHWCCFTSSRTQDPIS